MVDSQCSELNGNVEPHKAADTKLVPSMFITYCTQKYDYASFWLITRTELIQLSLRFL